MKKIFTLLIGLALLSQAAFAQATYLDVPENHQYAPDILYIEQLGIEPGVTFRPNEPITREKYAVWLLKNAGFVGEGYRPRTKKRFVDVKLKTSSGPYIYRLADLGVIEFSKGTAFFKPESEMTKKEALEWLFAVEGVPVPKIFDEHQFQATDVRVNATIAPLIHKAIQLGLLKPGKAAPYRKITRAQAAHFLKTIRIAGNTLTVTILPTIDSDLIRNDKFDVMVAAWNRIFQTYLKRKDVNRDQLIYGAIEGMVKELDDKHSDFERPGDNALIESLSGEIEGIGAVIQMKDEDVVIVAPIAGSPAAKAGLKPNDIITMVDEVSVKGMKLSEVVARIKGKKGTQVELTILRKSKTLTYTITRDVVKIISASMERTEDNFAVITLSGFGETTLSEFQGVVSEIATNKPKGIILDLRNNPGGFLDTAVRIAGYFIPRGEKITIVRYPDHEETLTSFGTAELKEYPLVVITNAGSASASEILAGALQDHELATVVGEKTFGKGTVQELSDFTDGSTLKLTVAEWLTPKGNSIEKNGIEPDIKVEYTEDDLKNGTDPQLERALRELRK